MSIIQGNAKTGASRSFYGFEIDQSLRFNSGDSAYLSRTTGSATNTYTFSTWLKRGDIPAADYQYIFSSSNAGLAIFKTGVADVDEIYVYNGSTVQSTDAKVRDPSSWYHIVLSVNSGTAAVYLNGDAIKTGLSAASLSTSSGVTRVGRYGSGNFYFDGYLAETHLVTGSALTPSSFGETKSDIWVPKEYTGSHGNDGFKLTYADSSAFGDDTSGEGHDLTSNNFATTDQVLDSPTNNFCTWNPLNLGGGALSDGNLRFVASNSQGLLCTATMALDVASTTHQYYWEITINSSGEQVIGIAPTTLQGSDTSRAGSYGYFNNPGTKFVGTSGSSYGADFGNGDVIGVAVGSGKITFFKNNVSQGDAFTGLTGIFVPFIAEVTCDITANFGQLPFTYTPPTGFVALSTANLPDPAIDPAKGESPTDYFAPAIWSGDNTSSRTIPLDFTPNFIWTKSRSSASSHFLYDTVRGLGADQDLSSDKTQAEGLEDTDVFGYIDSSGGTGFNVVAGSSNRNFVNENGRTYVAWNWKAGTSFSNDASATGVGTIDSTGSVSTEAGFSVISYTGNGTAGASIAHGLGAVPEWIIVKNRGNLSGTESRAWTIYHSALGATKYIEFSTSAADTGTNRWNDTAPTSSVFTVGDGSNGNENGDGHIAYCFAPKEGYSKFSSYVGNGSTDGPFVYTGFRPAFVLSKGLFTKDWVMVDNKRNTYNVVNKELFPNQSYAEATNDRLDFVSNGFKVTSSGAQFNDSGSTYIYMAFAEQPFKFSNAR